MRILVYHNMRSRWWWWWLWWWWWWWWWWCGGGFGGGGGGGCGGCGGGGGGCGGATIRGIPLNLRQWNVLQGVSNSVNRAIEEGKHM